MESAGNGLLMPRAGSRSLGRFAGGLLAVLEGGADLVEGVGVGLAVGAHGGGQGEVLGGGLVVAVAGEREAEAEVGVVVGRGGLDDRAEVGRGGLVLAGVELGAGQGLADAARGRLGVGRPLQNLGGGGGAALAEQFHAGGVPVVHLGRVRVGAVAAPAAAPVR